MFDLNRTSTRFIANFGFSVTFIVLCAACSHEQIQVVDHGQIPAEMLTTTPEPETAVADLPVNPVRQANVKNTKGSMAAKRAKRKARLAARKQARKKAAAVARIDDKSELNGPAAPVTTLNEIANSHDHQLPVVEMPNDTGTLVGAEQTRKLWGLWLGSIALATGGLLWLALRRTSHRRGKSARRLIFSTPK
jgi:hypothetical protein